MKNTFFILSLLFFLASCRPNPIDEFQDGMKPVYASFDDFSHIKSEDPRSPENLGKIVVVNDYIFINELYQGIHVINNTIPTSPVYEHFWAILGNTEFTIEGNTLYADNSRHLIVIDISDFEDIQYQKHIEDFYGDEFVAAYRPPNYQGPFQCVNPDAGIVVDWVMDNLKNPLCNAY